MGGDLKSQLAALKNKIKTKPPESDKKQGPLPQDEKAASQSSGNCEADDFAEYCASAGVERLEPGSGGQATSPVAAHARAPSPARKGKLDPYNVVLTRIRGLANRSNREEQARFNQAVLDVYGTSGKASSKPLRTPEVHTSISRNATEALKAAKSEYKPVALGGLEMPPTGGRDASYLEGGWRIDERRGGGKTRSLVMGIDFGTAYSKVCIGDAVAAYPVCFYPGSAGVERYLLPGLLAADRDGLCHLGERPDRAHLFENLKLPILEGRTTDEDQARAIAFLALIMRYSRTWLLAEHGDIYRGVRIDWAVNIGLPTDSWNDRELTSQYHGMALVAWLLSVEETPVSMRRARELVGRMKDARMLLSQHERGLDLESINVVPEFAGQVASYIRSPQRNRDLHVMVDVGAGTVDISTFNVHDDNVSGSDVLPVFAARVVRLGTHYLMACRLYQAAEVTWSDTLAIPSAAVLARELGCEEGVLQARDEVFCTEVAGTLRQVLHYTKRERYRLSPHWSSGIPTFLCGGGGSVSVYRQAVSMSGFPLQPVVLGKPSRLKARDVDDLGFGRLSIAYGLSFGFEDLGNLRPAGEVPDDVPVEPGRDMSDDFVSKDRV